MVLEVFDLLMLHMEEQHRIDVSVYRERLKKLREEI
jgi:hypothetical protein